jgi:hypothetical protein
MCRHHHNRRVTVPHHSVALLPLLLLLLLPTHTTRCVVVQVASGRLAVLAIFFQVAAPLPALVTTVTLTTIITTHCSLAHSLRPPLRSLSRTHLSHNNNTRTTTHWLSLAGVAPPPPQQQQLALGPSPRSAHWQIRRPRMSPSPRP